MQILGTPNAQSSDTVFLVIKSIHSTSASLKDPGYVLQFPRSQEQRQDLQPLPSGIPFLTQNLRRCGQHPSVLEGLISSTNDTQF